MSKKNIVLIILLFLLTQAVVSANPAAMAARKKNAAAYSTPPVPRNISLSGTLEIELIGSLDIPKGAQQIRVWGNYAYIIDGNKIIRVIDISNPSTPMKLILLRFPQKGTIWKSLDDMPMQLLITGSG